MTGSDICMSSQVQLHADTAAKRPQSQLSIWEAGTGVLTAQGACEHHTRSLAWFCGPGLPECLCLTQVSLPAKCC